MLAWLPALAAVGGSGEPWLRASLAFASRLRLVLLLAAALGAISAAAGVVLEGAEAAGISGFSALKETIVRETLETKFGTIWGLAALAWIAFGLLVALTAATGVEERAGAPGCGRRSPPFPSSSSSSFRRCRDTAAPSRRWPSTSPSTSSTSTAMAVWLGGLATLLFVAPRGTRELEPGDRSRLLAAALSRFSEVALIAVGAILLTGLIQAYVYVRHLDDLLGTGYGRAVLIKFCLLLVLIAIGAYNRRRSLPRLNRIAAGGESPGRAGLLLRRALRAEVALLVIVIGVTAALASYAPPVSAQGGPFSTETLVGPIQLEMSVEPATVGANEIHLYLFDAKSGAPYAKVKQLKVVGGAARKGDLAAAGTPARRPRPLHDPRRAAERQRRLADRADDPGLRLR